MLVKQRMIYACDLSITLQFLIITYVEGRVLGAARSCWASLGPWCNLRDAPGLVHGCRSDPNPCRHITRLAVDQGEFRMLALSQHRPVNPRFDQCGGLPVGEPPHRNKPAEDLHEQHALGQSSNAMSGGDGGLAE